MDVFPVIGEDAVDRLLGLGDVEGVILRLDINDATMAASDGSAMTYGATLELGAIDVDFAYAATPDDIQTYPVDGRVLVLHVAVLRGEHASGVWNIRWGNIGLDGGGIESFEWTTVPAPGALALLGLAGLTGARSRRRRSRAHRSPRRRWPEA